MGKSSPSPYVLVYAEYDQPFSEGCPLSFDSYKEAFKYAFSRWRFERSEDWDHCCYWLHSPSGWKCISDLFFEMFDISWLIEV